MRVLVTGGAGFIGSWVTRVLLEEQHEVTVLDVNSNAFQRLGPDAHSPSLQRIGFEPRGKASRDLWSGEAVVDPAAGEVKWMKQRPSDLPAFVERIEMVLEFGAATSEGSAVSTVRLPSS